MQTTRPKPYVFIFADRFNTIERVAALGYTPVVIHHERVATTHFSPITIKQAVSCQFDRSFVEQFSPSDVVGLIVTNDYYVELAAHIRESYFPHLSGLTPNQADLVRDKLLLKRTLQSIGIPSARFCPITDYASMRSFLGTPFLIKPRRGAMTEGISIIRSESEWDNWAIENSVHNSFYAEEYLENVREFCCDTIVANGTVLVQFPGEYTVDCFNFRRRQCGIGVDYPGFVPTDAIESLKSFTQRFIRHSQISNGFFHTEFFHTTEGWKFSEIGCRLPGALQLPAESAMAGIDLLDLYLRIFITTERTPTTPIDITNRYYGYYLYPLSAGRIVTIGAELMHPWIVDAKIYHQIGDIVTTDMSNFFAGHIIYQARTLDELRLHSQQAPHLLKVTSEAEAG